MTAMRFRPQTRRWAALLVVIAAGTYVTGVSAQWSWKEDNGRVVYSDRPPPPEIKASQILRQPTVQAPAPQPAAPAAAGDPAKAAGGPKTIAERDMEFRKRQQERADTERKAQEEQQKSAAKATECERARGYLRSLEDGMRITRTDASGNREFLDDAERAQETERTRKMVQSLCN
jgi:cell division protein FtsN